MHIIDIAKATVHADDAVILHDVNCRIDAQQNTTILGANGSGKSKLVKLITRQVYPAYGGEVRIFGSDSWNVFELRKLLGIVSSTLQNDFDAPPPLEVLECVVSGFFSSRGLYAHTEVTEEMRRASLEALELVEAADLIGRTVDTLSTGQARRVLIARALAHKPRALLLDEPCAGLDPAARYHFLQTLRGVLRGGTTLLMVTHHIEEILPEMDHVVMLRDGHIVHQGDKRDLLTSPVLTSLFGIPMQVTQHGDWFQADVRP